MRDTWYSSTAPAQSPSPFCASGPPANDPAHRRPGRRGRFLNLPTRCQRAGRTCSVDPAPQMIEHAHAKLTTADLAGRLLVGDATAPPTGQARFDVVLCRHLMRTLPDPTAALTAWTSRIRPGGPLVPVEGR
ncbi:class I SAM-dependent methyltransferase [Streptomyces desertarenae]|uniref:Class I SAM-dependent methyltransferase n=1 Tax=Streptomyces desertarenae TaxID=2666184 RepID=A0ABW4PNB7_9ACTN